jgi:hypothetical protein
VSPTRRRSTSRGAGARRKTANRRDFWEGVTPDTVDEIAPVRAPDDPSAMIRSLGAPPLPGRETIAERYFALAFDKASRRAVALAAASGLIDLDDAEA